MNRIKTFDYIKGISIIMIILVHYNQVFLHNLKFFEFFQMGCQFFFVISGFLAAKSFAKKTNETKKQYKKASQLFYISKIRNIIPPWYIMIIVIYLINTISIMVTGNTVRVGTNRSIVSIICNLLFLNGLLPFCNNTVMPGGWYIGTTMIFYAFTPLLYYFLNKTKNKKMLIILVSLLGIGIIVTLSIVFSKYKRTFINNNSFGYFSALTQFVCFGLGMLLYFEVPKIKKINKNIIKYSIVGTLMLILAIINFFYLNWEFKYLLEVILVAISAYLIICSMLIYEYKNKGYKRNIRILELFGKKSLYIFLVHTLFAYIAVDMLKWIGYIKDNYTSYFVLMPIVIIFSCVGGILLEKISNNMKKLINNFYRKYFDKIKKEV